MENEYNFDEIEKKWQEKWMKEGYLSSKHDEKKEKFYCLVMFPYPSGKIHIGHVRNYTIGDIIARIKKLQGFNVFHPIGWDSFGLPAENAAIDKGIHPAKWTFENIDYMRSQLKKLGISYDWDREIASCTPEYYKWNQWFFLEMHEKGLVEKKTGIVNWCEKCQTVLANEQVEDGKCWRCSRDIEPKELSQWYYKITNYAQQLLDDHQQLEGNWPERVLTMQKNWIGRSVGLKVNFKLDGQDFPIFTTRPDTIFGVSFMAIAPEHPLVKDIIEQAVNKNELQQFVDKVKKESTIERTAEGVDKNGIFSGKYVENPYTGEKVPLYIADFVLVEYGTGAVMAVPAHDQRDFQFAKKYNIPIKIVIQNKEQLLKIEEMTEAYVDEGILINSGEFDGIQNIEAKEKIISKAEKLKIGSKTVNFRLKDWLISRQRYWGTPIPVIYCDDCGTVPVKRIDLPVMLPENVKFDQGGNPLLSSDVFVKTVCPKCGKPATRETDTMDTFIDSSWYYARYISPKLDSAPFDKKEANYWLDVDQYIGGIEHAVMHLLYSRFFHKVMRDIGLIDSDEPFKKLLTQGMVVDYSYQCKGSEQSESCHNAYYPPEELNDLDMSKSTPTATCPTCKRSLTIKIDKMSKSKKNGIDPDDLVKKYGADTVRLFTLFASPPERDLAWSDRGVEGGYRFLKRVHNICVQNYEKLKPLKDYDIDASQLNGKALETKKFIHKTIKKVTNDFIDRYHFNTGIAALMELSNHLNAFKPENENDLKVLKEGIIILLRLLFPVAPHMSEELYENLDGAKASLYDLAWPVFNEALTKDDVITYVVQVNGKVRGKLEVEAEIGKDDVLTAAKQISNVEKNIEGKTVIKEIFVPKKLVNIVVK